MKLPLRQPMHDKATEGCLSLLFRAGERPTADQIAQLLDNLHSSGSVGLASYRPDPDAGWLEILAGGLTMDMVGLAPAVPTATPETRDLFGFEEQLCVEGCQPVGILPSAHVASGAALQPVLRAMMGLAANLVLNLPVTAVHWGPAQTLMDPRYFAHLMLNWLSGGAFPALGLIALARREDGSVVSKGLSYFIGQEMQLVGKEGESDAIASKLAVRVVDHLVRYGRMMERNVIGTGADALLIEPSQVGKLLLVWRGE